jgi:poly-gamma-glutamate synthesis protein (capsule biosynthesis protein)
VHYGLGNFLFDQMYEGNRRGFLDRHVFYDGKYINTELLTIILEDGAQPRPMNVAERHSLLEAVFASSVWSQTP